MGHPMESPKRRRRRSADGENPPIFFPKEFLPCSALSFPVSNLLWVPSSLHLSPKDPLEIDFKQRWKRLRATMAMIPGSDGNDTSRHRRRPLGFCFRLFTVVVLYFAHSMSWFDFFFFFVLLRPSILCFARETLILELPGWTRVWFNFEPEISSFGL